MKSKTAIAALAATLAVLVISAPAQATVYNVDFSLPPFVSVISGSFAAGSLTGTITTDNTLVGLVAGNITAWNFDVLAGSLSTHFGVAGSTLHYTGGLTATATDLLFDFGTIGNLFSIENNRLIPGGNFFSNVCFQVTNSCDGGEPGLSLGLNQHSSIIGNTFGRSFESFAGAGTQVIASTVSPVPGPIVGAGIPGLMLGALSVD